MVILGRGRSKAHGGGRLQVLDGLMEGLGLGTVQVGFVCEHNQVLLVTQVLEQVAGGLVEPADAPLGGLHSRPLGFALCLPGGNQLLDIENEKLGGLFSPEELTAGGGLGGTPGRVILGCGDLGLDGGPRDVAARAGGEVLHSLGLYHGGRGHHHDVADALPAQVLDEPGHQVGLAGSSAHVHHLGHGRVIVTGEGVYEDPQAGGVVGAESELAADLVDYGLIPGDT